MKQKIVRVGGIEISNTLPFVLIAGPDSIESENHAMMMATHISSLCKKLEIPYIFKASYDKANRTSINSFRGVGVNHGAEILKNIKEKLNIPVTDAGIRYKYYHFCGKRLII